MDDKRADRLELKMDRMLEKLEVHSVLHSKNTLDLAHHIMRCDLLEEAMDEIKATTRRVERKADRALFPIRAVKYMGYVVLGVGAVVSMLYGALKYFFHHLGG